MDQQNYQNTEQSIRRHWVENEEYNRPMTAGEMYGILRRNSLIARLRRRAFMIFVLGCTGPFWICSLARMQEISVLLQVVYIAFMFICGIVELYWWYRLGKVYRYMAIPVTEAQMKMEELGKIRRYVKYGTWILGAPVLFLLFSEIALEGSEYSLYGAIFGAVIGLSIGLTIEFKNRRQLKAIKKSFSDLDNTSS